MCSTYAKTTDTDNNDRRRSSSTGVDKELCVCVSCPTVGSLRIDTI